MTPKRIRFSLSFAKIRWWSTESRKRILKIRISLGPSGRTIGECAPMPLYFYWRDACGTADRWTVSHVYELDGCLSLRFKMSSGVSRSVWIYGLNYATLMMPPGTRRPRGLKRRAEVSFRYHPGSRTIVGPITIVQAAQKKELAFFAK